MTSSLDIKRSPYRFGEKLRAVRERKGLTLRQVALSAGVSESLVSQIERNKVSPAIDTLLSIAVALDINLEYLFEEFRQKRKVNVVRAGERRTILEGEAVYEELAKPPAAGGIAENGGRRELEACVITLPPGARTRRGSYGHLGIELGAVIEGEAVFEYEGEKYALKTGDSVSFSASVPHTLSNEGGTVTRAFWVFSPPQRWV